MLSIIAAVGDGGVIGWNGQLPWRLPADLARFRKITMGKPVIMGRKTFESLPAPLDGRMNIVLSSRMRDTRDVRVLPTLRDARTRADSFGPDAFVIGGSLVFAEALPLADMLYLTRVEGTFPGDAFFPAINEMEWSEVWSERFDANEHNPYPTTFTIQRRIGKAGA